MWEAKALRDLAIKYLSKLDVVDMILLGTEYRVSQWIITGCTKLIMRSPGPTEEECNLLGIAFIVQIYGLRERIFKSFCPSPTTGNLNLKGPEGQLFVSRLVRETFPDRIFD